jgi:hypothetical protein
VSDDIIQAYECPVCKQPVTAEQEQQQLRQAGPAGPSDTDPVVGAVHAVCLLQQEIGKLQAMNANLSNLAAAIVCSLGGSVRVHKSHAEEASKLENAINVEPQPDDYFLLTTKTIIIATPRDMPRMPRGGLKLV